MLILEEANERFVGKWKGSEKVVHAAAWYSSATTTRPSMDDDDDEETGLKRVFTHPLTGHSVAYFQMDVVIIHKYF